MPLLTRVCTSTHTYTHMRTQVKAHGPLIFHHLQRNVSSAKAENSVCSAPLSLQQNLAPTMCFINTVAGTNE